MHAIFPHGIFPSKIQVDLLFSVEHSGRCTLFSTLDFPMENLGSFPWGSACCGSPCPVIIDFHCGVFFGKGNTFPLLWDVFPACWNLVLGYLM